MENIKSPKLNIITIEQPTSGWIVQQGSAVIPVEQTQEGVSAIGTPVKKNQGYSFSSSVDLYRNNFIGHLAAGQTLSVLVDPGSGSNANNKYCAGTNVVNGLAVAVTALFGCMWTILDNFRLVNFTELSIGGYTGAIDLPYTSNSLSITGHSGHTPARSNNGDVISLTDFSNSDPYYLLYTWEDNTDGDIGYIQISPSGGSPGTVVTNTPNWGSQQSGGTILIAGVPHKIAKGSDGNIYVTNGQYIAYIGTEVTPIYGSPTLVMQSLNLGNGWTAVHMVDYQGFLIIIGYSSVSTDSSGNLVGSGHCRIWWWNYLNVNASAPASPTYVFDLDDYYGDALFVHPDGTLYALTHGKDNSTCLWAYDGSQFATKFKYLTSKIGSLSIPSAIDTYQKLLQFGGGIISNALAIGQWDGGGYHQPGYQVAWGFTPANTGFVKNLDDGKGLYISAVTAPGGSGGFTEEGAIAGLNGGFSPGAVFDSDLKVLQRRSRLVKVRVYFSQFGTVGTGILGSGNPGAKIKLQVFNGYDTSTDLIGLTVSYFANGALTEFTKPCNILLDSFWAAILWQHVNFSDIAAVIRKVEFYIEDTDFVL